MNHEVMSIAEPPREGLRDRMLLLRSQSMFEGLDDDGLIMLTEHARSVVYHEGDVITREGEPGRAFHVIVAGEVDLFQQERHLGTWGPGGAFGGFHLLARGPSPLAVAREDVRMLEVPGSAFETAIDENYTALRGALRAAGSALLRARGNLPVDADPTRAIDEGIYYAQPKSMVERLVQLRAGAFGYMNLEALVDLARHMNEVRLPAGHLLWAAGDLADFCLYLDCGRVRCTAPDGGHVDLGRDFTLGVLDLWGTQQRAYSARTETPVIAYRIQFEGFLTLLESHVEVGIQILRGFAQAFLTSRAMLPEPTQLAVRPDDSAVSRI
jgi:CRP-like cAMP-binding protein